MNQHDPNQPNTPYNQPYPPQQPGQPWGVPQPPVAPQPPKKSRGKKAGLGCLGILGVFVLIGIVSAVAGGGSNDDTGGKDGQPAVSTPADSGKGAAKDDKPAGPAKKSKPAPTPVKVTAKKTAFTKSILADGSNYTSVLVTITNNSSDTADVNPLYFAITDTSGGKHTAEIGVDDKQIDTVDLAPGENITGTITGTGRFTAKYVTFTDGLFGDSLRANVS